LTSIAFECTITDLPRAMLVNHPHLISDVQIAVVVTELTLAAARDSIRILSWLKSNAPQTQVFVVANKLHGSSTLEINRKDFEGSIERKIDFAIGFDQKLAAQAAKLGKPLAEVGKGNKGMAALGELSTRILAAADGKSEDAPDRAGKKEKAKGAGSAAEGGATSLMGKFGDLKSLMPRRAKAK